MKSNTKRFRYILGFLLSWCAVLALLAPVLPAAAADTYTIKAVACAGGTISPSGTTAVNAGESLTYTIKPGSGKHIQAVWIDKKESVGTPASYTFEDIQGNHTIAVSFTPYSLQIAAGSITKTLNTTQFEALPRGNTFNDNNEAAWMGVSLYELIKQVYPGDSTAYSVSAVTSDPANNDITFTNDNDYPFLGPDKDSFIVADRYSSDNGVTWGPVPPTSAGAGGWTWAPLRLIGPRQDGTGGSAFHHSGAGLIKLEITGLPPWITAQPAKKSVKSGSSASFTAAAGGDPAPTVQWQVSTDEGSNWSAIPEATGSKLTLKPVTTSQSGNQYRAVFTNSLGSATSEAVTLTVTPSGSGGGGGGGGSSNTSVAANLFGRTSSLTVNSSGVVQGTFTAASADGMLSLTVPAGTTLKDAAGGKLLSLGETPNTGPPPPPSGTILAGPAFNLEPEGATFSPPITFTYSYDPSRLPDGIEEADLALAFYDTGAGVWTNLPGTVDETKHTLTVPLSHFTTFAVMGTLPAAFTAGLKEVSPREADPGEKVNITVSVANSGGKDGEYTATLSVNGTKEGEKSVAVKAGGSADVVFTVSQSQPGEYIVNVGGAGGRFKVVAPAAFSLSLLTVQPARAKPGEAVTVSAAVSNTGGKKGSYLAVLTVNGAKNQEKSVTVSPGLNKMLDFELTAGTAGEYKVAIDQLEGGFTVEAPVSGPPITAGPAPPAAPASGPASTAASENTAGQSLNWVLIGGILGAVVLVLLCFILLMKRKKTR